MIQFDSLHSSGELEKFITYFNTISKSANVDEVNKKCGGMTLPIL